MHKVKKIRITGFRRLRDIEIEMRPLMVLIGANSVGKTSILDAVSLLSASAAGNLNMTLNNLGGVADVSTRGQLRKITLDADMECPGYEPLHYQLEIEARGQGYAIPVEKLTQAYVEKNLEPFKYIDSQIGNITYFDKTANSFVRPNWKYNPFESSLSQVPKMYEHLEEFRRTLSFISHYHVLDVGPRAPIKFPQQMKPSRFPGEYGDDLVSFLFNLRESDPDRYEIIEDTLRAAFPGFEELKFPIAAAGMLSLAWKEKQFKDPIYAHQLSEGTLRFLWLISLLQSPDLSAVTMIDEPEVSLHPEMLSLLSDAMKEAAKRTQIIVATHSDRLIRFLDPGEVFVMDIGEDGCALGRWADSVDLEKWLVDYTLDEIWRMGRIGGRA